MRAIALMTCALWSGGWLAAQASFEVASVKPAQASAQYRGCKGGPGTGDPGYWTCTRVPIPWLIETAYDLQPYGLVRQTWMSQLEFDIAAKVPVGTSKQRFRQMQQDLLVTRFHLQFRYEPKEMPVSKLTVEKPERLPVSIEHIDRSDSFVPGPMSTLDGRRYWKVKDVSMDDLVQVLGLQLGGPVTDATGLKGRYDVSLEWAVEMPAEVRAALQMAGETVSEGEGGPTLRQALLAQLGLKLEVQKGKVSVMVIDHADRTPAAN